MSRTGYSKPQQHQVKQLIFECALSKMTAFQIQQILKEKLDVDLGIAWINRIKAGFREDTRREYYSLLKDDFSYKHLQMEVMHQLHELIRQGMEIANNNKGKNDLIALKALSEVRESVIKVSECYKSLPEVESNLITLKVNHKHNNEYDKESDPQAWLHNNDDHEDFENLDLDKEPSLTEEEKEKIRTGYLMIVCRDNKTGELVVDDTTPEELAAVKKELEDGTLYD
jgi:hypothetical protein